MNNVMQQTDHLVEAIHASNEYTQYQMLQNAISKDGNVYARLNEFRRRNFEIQMNNSDNSIDECANLRQEYADVLNRGEVKDFLSAEQRYIKMLRKMYHKLETQLHVNINFLE